LVHTHGPHGIAELPPHEKTKKWLWIIYRIPADDPILPENIRNIGTMGDNSVNDNTHCTR
jgi:hypothetical protein